MLEVAEKRLAASFMQLRLLPQLDFGVALLLLRFCISPRVAFLAGQLPDVVIGALAPRWDAAIAACLTSMFRCSPPARCFVSGPGGLDISVLAEELHVLRLNGWSRAKVAIGQCLPSLAHLTVIPAVPTHPVHAEVVRAWEALPLAVAGADGVRSPFADAAPTTAPPPSTTKAAVVAAQHKLSNALSTTRRAAVRAGLTPLGRLLWERAADTGAKHWLNMTPLYASRRLSSDEHRVATCIWLHGDIAELIGGSAEPTGRSTMRADRAGRIHRHHRVARTYADLCFEAGHRVWIEAPVFPEFTDATSTKARGGVLWGSLRRIDVLATPIGGLTGHAIDPRVMDPARSDLLERWAASASSPCPLKAAEDVKYAHYADLPLAWKLRPCGHACRKGPWAPAHTLVSTRWRWRSPPGATAASFRLATGWTACAASSTAAWYSR